MSDERDVSRMMDAVRLTARIFASRPLGRTTGGGFTMAKPAGLMRYNLVSDFNARRSALAAALLDVVPPFGRAVIARIAGMRPLADLVGDEGVCAPMSSDRLSVAAM